MKSLWPLLALGCGGTDELLCKDGYGMDEGRCVPLAGAGSGDDTAGPGPNTAPTAPGLTFRPVTPRASGSPLTCVVQSPSVDVDGDPVTYRFSWESDDGTRVDGPAVDGTALSEGSLWTCSAVPSDGLTDGPAATVEASIGRHQARGDDERTLADSDYLFTGEFLATARARRLWCRRCRRRWPR